MLWAYQTFFEQYPQSKMIAYAALQLARVHVEQGRPCTAAAYLYWLIDHEKTSGYKYTVPQTQIDDLFRQITQKGGCQQ